MKSKKLFALLTLFALLSLCLTAGAWAAMNDKDFVELCEKGTVQEIRSALLKGADVNAKSKDEFLQDRTALMAAAQNNETWDKSPEVISLLLKAGADVNAKNENGWTALMRAAGWSYNPKVVSALLKAGADVNAKNKYGKTALMCAYIHPISEEVVSLLLKAGADVNAKDENGSTALMIAALNNPTKVISLLLKAGADVNVKNKNGNTALMFAAGWNYKNQEVTSLLLKAGADINVKDNKGKTALDYAREENRDVAIKVLEEAAIATDPEALYQLGIKYATGDGVEVDEKKAAELLRKAAKQGHKKAKDALKLF